MKPLRDMPLARKFFFGTGLIIVLFWCVFNVLIYLNLKDNSIRQTYEKTDILFSHIQATIDYIRKQLRPKLFHILPDDAFVREAMSVSFMNREIMSEFRKRFSGFEYRRVAIDPMNPENRPDDIELRYIALFREGKTGVQKEIIERDGRDYFIHARPIVVEAECLSCHGAPENAPATLVGLYGTEGGFNRKLGEIIGVESIAIPLDETLSQIRSLVLSIFFTGIVGVFLLFLTVNYYINIVAIRPIRSVSRFFKSVVEDGRDLDTRLIARSRDEIGELVRSFNQMMDYLKSSEEQLRNSESKYRRIFEGSKDAILVADCEGRIQDINRAGLELFGNSGKERLINEKTLPSLFLDSRRYDDFFASLREAGYVKDYETQLKGIGGKVVDVLITASFRMDEDGNVCGYEAIIKDITEWKEVQEQLKEADRLASIGQLASGLAHEINNPLGIVMGYTGLLLKEAGDDSPLRDDLRIVYKNAEACKRIVEDLLKFSRRTETRPEPHDITAIVDEVIEMFSYTFEERGIRVVKDYKAGIPEVMVDAEKIRQVFMNIVMNACQAIGAEGTVEIGVCYGDAGREVIISISDDGAGIPDVIRGRVFEPFFTTKEPGEGTGLGLSVSYGIIKEHGGDIMFESVEGEGSTFIIKLPLRP
ncbi:MAG: DUF3365 domain-containing protein [Nitrospirae bacterium]|nr:DUF3365 domain-containing protein [Nitrospirota bacterium]